MSIPSGSRATRHEPSQLMTQEQTNTSIRFGDRYVLKLFRKLETGTHPDVEIARFLGRKPRFPHVAALHGILELHVARPGSRPGDGQATTLAMLSQWVANAEDAWAHVVDQAEAHLRGVVSGAAGRAVAGTKAEAIKFARVGIFSAIFQARSAPRQICRSSSLRSPGHRR